jgi:hypothetical protein
MKESLPKSTSACVEDLAEQQVQQQRRWDQHDKRMNLNRINNDKYIALLNKRKITYGSPIQLMHVDSGYFL